MKRFCQNQLPCASMWYIVSIIHLKNMGKQMVITYEYEKGDD
jgi:hypothetical protein